MKVLVFKCSIWKVLILDKINKFQIGDINYFIFKVNENVSFIVYIISIFIVFDSVFLDDIYVEKMVKKYV